MSMLVTRRRRNLAIMAAVFATFAALLPAGPARAADPTFVGWSAALPAFTWGYDPNSSDDCVSGGIACVDKAIGEMQRRLAPLAASCAHASVFGLASLRTTQVYRRTAETDGFYRDPGY